MTSFNISFIDTAIIIATAISTILVGECNYHSNLIFIGISWLLIYRS